MFRGIGSNLRIKPMKIKITAFLPEDKLMSRCNVNMPSRTKNPIFCCNIVVCFLCVLSALIREGWFRGEG